MDRISNRPWADRVVVVVIPDSPVVSAVIWVVKWVVVNQAVVVNHHLKWVVKMDQEGLTNDFQINQAVQVDQVAML